MASLKVAVRVRPLNKREEELNSKCIIEMQGQKTTIFNTKLPEGGSEGDRGREFKKDFLYDYSYWSANPKDPHYVNQDQVFEDLGLGVLDAACEGYNTCIFAYGQTGAGKTYTMMGTNDEVGLIPRICKGLFNYVTDNTSITSSFRTEVSYLEIYNEHVRDLLRPQNLKRVPQQNLKVREHPKEGPYVEGLTKQHVSDYDSVEVLMEQGSRLRATASTKMNDTSSRSHAIFTVKFTQAKLVGDMPSETISKIHLVDLAGSERASTSGATGERLKEGANINKSLVTLGIVISTLAENSAGSSAVGKRLAFRKKLFVPYRDSVLTFLLKDSLGGNSKTVMIAAVSPAECNYGETLSTLRYAHRAKSIINRPTINEDPNVKLIRELRMEIERLKGIIKGSALGENDETLKAVEKLHENEVRVQKLTKDWSEKWREAKAIMQESELALRRQGSCVVLVDLELPHLVRLEEDVLRTGIMLYRIMHGKTCIGREDAESPQDIILEDDDIEKEHCVLDFTKGQVTLEPLSPLCWVNGVGITQRTKLNQGDVVVLGKTNVFKFNFPTEAAKLREKRRSGLYSSGSVESLSSYYISPVRGSHGDLSMRSDCSSPITLDSGVEADIGDNTEDIRNQISDLIVRHKESEVRRMEIEKAHQNEISAKQAELDEHRKAMDKVREYHKNLSEKAKAELDQVRQQMQRSSVERRDEIGEQMGLLIQLKNGSADSEDMENEKQMVKEYLADEWQKIEQYEMSLADIELEKRRALAQAERDLETNRAVCDAERDLELKQLDEQEERLLELREYLNAIHSTPSRANKATLERYINQDQEELEQIEQNISLLKSKQRQLEKLRPHSFLEETGEESDLATAESEANKSASTSKEKGGVNEELGHWINLKKEKERVIDETRQIISGNPEASFCQDKLKQIERQLSELEGGYTECREKHASKLQATMESLSSQHAVQIHAIESEREKCIEGVWEEYEGIKRVLNESVESSMDDGAVDAQRHKTLEFVKEKLKRFGSDEDENFLEYLAKRTKFDKEEDRMFEQESKLSSQIFEGQKEKEVIVQKLSMQRDRFHVERERERRLIKSRIKRLQRLKTSGDLQNEETLEYLKEETDKLKEAYEKVEEADHRLSLELKQKEALGLQLEEARAKLMSSEEDRDECETNLSEMLELNRMKEKEIRDLKKQMEEERKNYLQNLRAEEYEIVEKPLVNRLHVKYRVIGNHAAAEVLKEAFMASTLPEMRKTYPTCSSPLPVKDTTHGGWVFHSIQKDVTIARKRMEGPSGHLHCFLGRGVIPAPAVTVWEAVRNPLSRYIYDNMLKKINIVEHVEDGLKVVYMLHETSQCFMTHSRDFCYVSKERTEGRKFVLASQSIEHPKCAMVPGIIRAQIVSSGWIVEPVEVDGAECSLVWYITKVHLGSNSLPWRLIDLLSKRQPLSIAFLRSYVSP